MQDTTEITYGTVEAMALEHSPQLGDLVTALAKAQAEMENPATDSDNPFFKSRYASMAATRNATVPLLAKHGIATTQHPALGKGWVRCITVLWFGDQYLKSTLQCSVVKTRRDGGVGQPIPVAELNHQDYSAVFSYIRRISLQAVCNVAGEEDDDGNQAVGKSGQTSQQRVEPERQGPPRPTAAEEAAQQAETARLDLLDEIAQLYKESIQPLKHAGMHKAIFFHCFHIDKPELIKVQSLETFQAGMALYRHLTAQLVTWDRKSKPDDWIGEQQRRLATQAATETAVPEGIDPETGEDHRDMPEGWLTEEERRAQQAAEDAALLEHAGQH